MQSLSTPKWDENKQQTTTRVTHTLLGIVVRQDKEFATGIHAPGDLQFRWHKISRLPTEPPGGGQPVWFPQQTAQQFLIFDKRRARYPKTYHK